MQDYSLGPCIPTDGNHYALLAHVLTLGSTGIGLEFGVGKGESLALIAAHMPAIGFDSFEGLPADWRPDFPAGSFAQDHPPAIDNADLVVGLFADTLPDCDFSDLEIGLVHLDADLFSSTATALHHVGPHLKPGCYIVFDEFHGFDGCEDHEQRAWREFTATRPELHWETIGHDFEQVAFRCV